MKSFKVQYQVSDGYVGKSRPLYFSIDPGMLEDEMTDNELKSFIDDEMQSHFEQNVMPELDTSYEEFIEWAREAIKENKK